MAKNGPIAKTVFTSPGQLPTHISLDQLKNSLNALESYAVNVNNCNCLPENCNCTPSCQSTSYLLFCQNHYNCYNCYTRNCSQCSTHIKCQYQRYVPVRRSDLNNLTREVVRFGWAKDGGISYYYYNCCQNASLLALRNGGQCFDCCQGDCNCNCCELSIVQSGGQHYYYSGTEGYYVNCY